MKRKTEPSTVILKITSAIAVKGVVVRPGQLIEMTNAEAINLLQRGKAELATEADEVKEDAPVDLSKLSKAQLVEAAAALGIDLKDSDTKAAIISAIEAKKAE